MRALVLGGQGYLGSYLTQTLGQTGHDVLSTSRKPGHNGIVFDLSSPDYVGLLKSAQPDVIFNCIGIPEPDVCEQSPELALQTNYTHVRRLVLAANELRSEAKLIHISTSYVYGASTDSIYSSTDIADPPNSYGAVKAAADSIFPQVYPNSIVVLLPLVIGHPSHAKEYVQKLLRKVESAEPLDSYHVKQPTDIDWVVRSMMDRIADGFNGRVFLGGEEMLTELEMGTILSRQVSLKPPIAAGKSRSLAKRPRVIQIVDQSAKKNEPRTFEKICRDLLGAV